MKDKEEQNTNKNFTKPNKGIFAKLIGWKNAKSKQTKADEQGKYTTDIKKEPNNITINIIENKNKTAIIANRISFFNMLVAVALTVFTYFLFAQTKNTLDEYKREFDATNRPDISLFDFKVFDSTNTVFMKCTFQIINTGKLRAKINYINVFQHLGIDTAHYIANDRIQPIPFNQYMQFNAAYTPDVLMNFVNENQKNDFINGKTSVFMDFNYEYYNEVVNKDYVVHFLVKLFYLNGTVGTVAIDFSEKEKYFIEPK